MKTIILILTLFSLTYCIGQTSSDALRYSYLHPVTGTARTIGIGSSIGALGGDFSSVSINPAGIAMYRSSEFTITPGYFT
jgi:hypothetical protein